VREPTLARYTIVSHRSPFRPCRSDSPQLSFSTTGRTNAIFSGTSVALACDNTYPPVQSPGQAQISLSRTSSVWPPARFSVRTSLLVVIQSYVPELACACDGPVFSRTVLLSFVGDQEMGCGASTSNTTATNTDAEASLATTRGGNALTAVELELFAELARTCPEREAEDGDTSDEPGAFKRRLRELRYVLGARISHGINADPEQFDPDEDVYFVNHSPGVGRVHRWQKNEGEWELPEALCIEEPDTDLVGRAERGTPSALETTLPSASASPASSFPCSTLIEWTNPHVPSSDRRDSGPPLPTTMNSFHSMDSSDRRRARVSTHTLHPTDARLELSAVTLASLERTLPQYGDEPPHTSF
jgi:hypothetical protein